MYLSQLGVTLLILAIGLAIALLIAVIVILKYSLPAYLTQRGQNLATKQDIEEITRKTEEVKMDFNRQIEGLRAGLGARLHVHRVL